MDGPSRLSEAPEAAALDVLGGDLGEVSLDETGPGCAGRREVRLEARRLDDPQPHLVPPVVAEHRVDVEVLLHAPADRPQDVDELSRGLKQLPFADAGTALYHRRGEQGRRPQFSLRAVLGSPRSHESRSRLASQPLSD